MRSRWSSANAKKMADEADKSFKDLHPDTRQAIKTIFDMITAYSQRISYHGFSEGNQKIVVKELRALGYEVINHKSYAGIGMIKYEVRVV